MPAGLLFMGCFHYKDLNFSQPYRVISLHVLIWVNTRFSYLSHMPQKPPLNTHANASSWTRSKFLSKSSSTTILCICEQ